MTRARVDDKVTEAAADAMPQPGDDVEPKQLADLHDVNADLFREIQQHHPADLEVERAAVRKKLDCIIMPVICITYTIQFLDKLSLNYASAYSLIPDLGLEGQRYSWVAAIFNFGYLFAALPANLMIQRFPIAKLLGITILCWSVLVCCYAATQNYAGILVLRFLLGVFEAGISPSIMNIVSMWYTRSEQPLRMCIFLGFNGVATIVGSLLGYGLGHVEGTIASWRLIFIVIGLLNFLWAIVFLLVTPDNPGTARWLTHRQKLIAIDRISRNMTGVKNPHYNARQVREAALDLKVWTLALMGIATGIINAGFQNFSTSLIKGYGFTGLMATLLQLPSGAVEFVFVPICGLIATYIKDTRCLVMVLISLAPLGGLLGIRFTGLEHRWTLVGCTWLQSLVGAPIILSWNLLATNIAGHTKRSAANGTWFVCYAAGNIAGAQVFFANKAPRYFSAITALCVSYGGLIALVGLLAVQMRWENARRDREAGENGEVGRGAEELAVLEGFRDRTDKESKGFRYCL